jgi:hypothetical protein
MATAVGGRALLPSQQARYPKSVLTQINRHPTDASHYDDSPTDPYANQSFGHAHKRSGSSNYEQQGQNGNGGLRPDDGKTGAEVGSIAGSVRRRYDGSSYGDYEY